MLHNVYLISFFVTGCLIDTVKVPDPKRSPADIIPTTSVIAYHPHKHIAAMATFLQRHPITIMMGNTVYVSVQRITLAVFRSQKQF